MASLEKQPSPKEQLDGPAEQAGVFLPEHSKPLIDLAGFVLHGTVSLSAERDPINALRRVTAACLEFGDDLKMMAGPTGAVHMFVREEAQERFQQKEAQRIQERIPKEIEAQRPLPPPEIKH